MINIYFLYKKLTPNICHTFFHKKNGNIILMFATVDRKNFQKNGTLEEILVINKIF